ncbi:MAG TPA: hypothetical protein PKI59_05245 [Candidatus Cloacimonadota bacterium]|nr:hypothetical protein [Candidatus Cloacimonadota bacterium]
MKQFKALLLKEFRSHRFVFLLPAFFLAGTYALFLISAIIGWIKMGNLSGVMEIKQMSPDEHAIIVWAANYISAMIMGWVTVIAGAGLVDHLLNNDYVKKCEIFHLSQPVSLKKIMGAKLSIVFGGELLLVLILVLVNSLVLGILFSILGVQSGFSGIVPAIQAFMATAITYISLLAVLWFFASLFRKNSGYYTILIIAGINIALEILKYFTGWDIYSPMDFITSSISNPIGLQMSNITKGMVPTLRPQAWAGIFNLDTLYHLLASAALIVLGYIAYHRREVK